MKRVACGVLLLLLTVCGCDGNTHKAGASGRATTPARSSGSAAATTARSSAVAGNPVDGKEFCAFLAAKAPRLKVDGSAAGAKADLAIELASWIEKHPDQKPRTGADLDDASQRNCPQTRTDVVTAMGATSFSEALG